MAEYTFDQLIQAIAGAVVEAESIVRQRQISGILSFFDQEGRPSTVDFAIPNPGAADTDTSATLRAPLLSLIPVTTLAIEGMDITFSTELGGISSGTVAPAPSPTRSAASRTATVPPASAQPLSVAGFATRSATIAVAPPATMRTASPSTATVTLSVKASEPPEGLARLIDRLNKLI